MIIGLTGYAHCGKDTCADYLVKLMASKGHSAVCVALADPLKKISKSLIELFYGKDIPLISFYDQDIKDRTNADMPLFAGQPFKIRTVLQQVGTEVFRQHLEPLIWCRYLKEHFLDTELYDCIIISDIRMVDELEYFRRLKSPYRFKCLRIVRPQASSIGQTHSSEAQIDRLVTDVQIDNSGTLEQTYAQLNSFISSQVPVLSHPLPLSHV
jgi:hypothetical protein